MERLICHMANGMAKKWQTSILPSQLDNGFNVRTNARTYVDNNLRKRSSSSVRDAGEFRANFSSVVAK